MARRAITLLELLAVVAIVGIIIIALSPTIFPIFSAVT